MTHLWKSEVWGPTYFVICQMLSVSWFDWLGVLSTGEKVNIAKHLSNNDPTLDLYWLIEQIPTVETSSRSSPKCHKRFLACSHLYRFVQTLKDSNESVWRLVLWGLKTVEMKVGIRTPQHWPSLHHRVMWSGHVVWSWRRRLYVAGAVNTCLSLSDLYAKSSISYELIQLSTWAVQSITVWFPSDSKRDRNRL